MVEPKCQNSQRPSTRQNENHNFGCTYLNMVDSALWVSADAEGVTIGQEMFSVAQFLHLQQINVRRHDNDVDFVASFVHRELNLDVFLCRKWSNQLGVKFVSDKAAGLCHDASSGLNNLDAVYRILLQCYLELHRGDEEMKRGSGDFFWHVSAHAELDSPWLSNTQSLKVDVQDKIVS